MSGCSYPSISEQQRDLITGTLMGDGSIQKQGDKNAHVKIYNTNKEYLEYIDSVLGNLSRGVSIQRTSEEVLEGTKGRDFMNIDDETEFKDQFYVRTMSHPKLNSYCDWYGKSGKSWPRKLELTPEIFRHLYSCDGHLNKENMCLGITCNNEREEKDKVWNIFVRAGFTPQYWNERSDSVTLMFSVDQTKSLLDWATVVPGMEYKWPEEYR